MPDDWLRDPDWFLDRLEPLSNQAMFVRSDVGQLSRAVFLDGRLPISNGESRPLALDGLPSRAHGEGLRMVLHMSFCGSTQLAHLVEASGAAVVLKEPHALVNLADWRRTLIENGVSDSRFSATLDASAGLLSRRWPDRGPTVIKPSNWANTLIPDLIGLAGDRRVVLITIHRRDLLRAVFRGGRDRMSFTARVAAHFAAAAREPSRVGEALAGIADPFDQIARLTLLAHHYQQRLFNAATAALSNTATIDLRLIQAEPAEALVVAATALNLHMSLAQIDAAVAERRAVDAKQPTRSFSAAGQARTDEIVEQHHANRFDRACAWADGQGF